MRKLLLVPPKPYSNSTYMAPKVGKMDSLRFNTDRSPGREAPHLKKLQSLQLLL